MRKVPSPGNIRQILDAVEKSFPRFNVDSEMRAMALVGLAQCVGVVATHILNRQGEVALEKGLKMVYAMAYDGALRGNAALRDRDAAMMAGEIAEKKQ